jgi:hypothetical protein
MKYQQLVEATLVKTDSTEAELQAYRDAPSKTKMPTPAEWEAFYAYRDRIKQQFQRHNR